MQAQRPVLVAVATARYNFATRGSRCGDIIFPGRKCATAFNRATPKHNIRPNDAKLRELILLISEWCQADPKFGAIKLNKLLFHADFSAFLT
jgi:hypothetical protein